MNLYWDDISQRGIIWRGSELVSFIPGLPVASVNLRDFVAIDPLYVRDGIIHIPDSTGELVIERLLPTKPEELRSITSIFIDPGHGGKDPGTIGTLASGAKINEKRIVLDVAVELARLLRGQFPEKRIILSRDSDVFLSLEERTEMANELLDNSAEKIVFISLHANAALNRQARGIEVWYLPPEYRRQVIQAGDVESESAAVLPILNTILEEEYTVESIILARNIEKEMLSELSEFTFSRGLKEMDWYVVRKARMPSVLVEVGFVTHKEEVELLNNDLYLKKVSAGIYNGVVNFIQDFENVSQ